MEVVPSGWCYWNSKTKNRYYGGSTLPSTFNSGDEYFAVNSDKSTNWNYPLYRYNIEHDVLVHRYLEGADGESKYVTCPEGWCVTSNKYLMKNLTIFDTIGNKNVVSIYLANPQSVVESVTTKPNVVIIILNNINTLKTINGVFSKNLVYCNFANNPNLESVTDILNGDSQQITNASGLFENCTSLKQVGKLPSNIISMRWSFYKCSSLERIDIPSSTNNIFRCFEGCTSLKSAPIYTGTRLVNVGYAFKDCVCLEDATGIDFSINNNIWNYTECFMNCENLINVSDVFYNNRTGSDVVANNLFRNCSKLNKKITFRGRWTSFSYAFKNCSSLEILPFFSSDCKPTTLVGCFQDCISLRNTSIRINASNLVETSKMFSDCYDFTGTIYFHNMTSSLVYGGYMFSGTTKTIIFIGDKPEIIDSFISAGEYSNVYNGLTVDIYNTSSVRVDEDGIPDDNNHYLRLTIEFTCPIISESKIYVPKIYVRNDQIVPIKDWTLAYGDNPSAVVEKVIPNSTGYDEYIEAESFVNYGKFEAIFNIENFGDDGFTITTFIPTSNSEIPVDWDDDNNCYIYDTVFWNKTKGASIFTGKDYIFDATPDGKSFKIGGPVDEENEKGFIVGNRGIPLLADQYPSTFNGPVTFNSAVYGVGGGGPVGSIIQYGGDVEPDGWFICNGRELSRETYSELFDAIGTTYGAGDGSTTFNIPDFRGKTAIGVSTDHAIGSSGGEETHLLTNSELPKLSGSLPHTAYGEGRVGGVFSVVDSGWSAYQGATTADGTSRHYEFNIGGDTAHNNMQPYLTVDYIIKWKNVLASGSAITVGEMADLLRPIGSAYSTVDPAFDPNDSWGGTWEKLPEGYVLLTGSDAGSYVVGDDTSTESGYKEYGSNTHTLSLNEIPSHDHGSRSLTGTFRVMAWNNTSVSGIVTRSNQNFNKNPNSGSNEGAVTYTVDATHTHDSNGGGQAHNIMQKSIAVYWWIRTA